jgi:hypothetical protein
MSSATSIWATKVSEGTGGDFEKCPPANHAAQVVGMFDVGHHDVLRTDKKTNASKMVETRQVVIAYELAELQSNGRPFVMTERLTFSLHKESNLLARVVNITGASLTPGETFDPTAILGRPVFVNVVHKKNGDGTKTYANMTSVSQPPRGIPMPAFKYTPILWSIQESKTLPDASWLSDVFCYGKSLESIVSESREFMGLPIGNAPRRPVPTPEPTPVAPDGFIPPWSAGTPAELSASARNSAPVVAHGHTIAYTTDVLALMKTYGLNDRYTLEDIPDQCPELHAEALADFAVRF